MNVKEMVGNGVVWNVTGMVEELRENDIERFEERCVNMRVHVCPECDGPLPEHEISNGHGWGQDNDGNDLVDEDDTWLDDSGICPMCDNVIAKEDWQYSMDDAEVLEWHIVHSWLARKLESRGEVIFDGDVWGRQASGQSIYMDSVMGDIALEL